MAALRGSTAGYAVLAGVLLLTGCTAGSPSTVETAGAPSVRASAPVESLLEGTTSASADPSREPAEGEPATLPPAPTAVPATASGTLTPDVLPAAGDLGPGWRTRVEGGDEEEGVGNGTAYQARDPREIVETTIPMGCARRSSSPVPRDVLQATYRHAGTGAYAVALRMRFSDATAAQRFAEIRGRDLEACRIQPDDPYSGAAAPVLVVSTGRDQQVARYEVVGESQTWLSALRIVDTDVLTVDSDAGPGTLDWQALGYEVP